MHPSMEVPVDHVPHFYHSYPPISQSQATPIISHPPIPMGPLECKIHEMNQRLLQRPDYPDRWWWDQFALEFFDDSAMMLISFCSPNEGEKNFTIARALIPQYFCAMFEGGATEMYFMLRFAREYLSQSGPSLECENTLTVTQYHQPSFARVLVESKLSFQCTHEEPHRIRSWTQYLIRHKEYLPRDAISLQLQDTGVANSLVQNVTHLGLNNCVLGFLNASTISSHAHHDIKPDHYHGSSLNEYPLTECQPAWQHHPNTTSVDMMGNSINSVLPGNTGNILDFCQSPNTSTAADSSNSVDRYQAKSPRPQKKPKKPKKSQTHKEISALPKKLSNHTSNSSVGVTSTTSRTSQSQDVMIVGEPVPMGGEIGEGDERQITRLENNSFTMVPGQSVHPNININPQIANGINGPMDSLDTECSEPSISAAIDALDGGGDSSSFSL